MKTEKNSKKWYYICERLCGPNYISRARIARTKQNLNRTHTQATHTLTQVHSKKPGKSIKDYFRSFFCTLICLQLIFFLADESKRNETSRAELSKSNKKKSKIKRKEKYK